MSSFMEDQGSGDLCEPLSNKRRCASEVWVTAEENSADDFEHDSSENGVEREAHNAPSKSSLSRNSSFDSLNRDRCLQETLPRNTDAHSLIQRLGEGLETTKQKPIDYSTSHRLSFSNGGNKAQDVNPPLYRHDQSVHDQSLHCILPANHQYQALPFSFPDADLPDSNAAMQPSFLPIQHPAAYPPALHPLEGASGFDEVNPSNSRREEDPVGNPSVAYNTGKMQNSLVTHPQVTWPFPGPPAQSTFQDNSSPGPLQLRAPSEVAKNGQQKAIPLYLSCDEESLSAYQCLARKQMELFEAMDLDVQSTAQGRNRAIVLGQVGIRCRHCSFLHPKHRARGAIYYPAKLLAIYQAAQNMASIHLCQECEYLPQQVRSELVQLRERKSSAGGGKKYWAGSAQVLGVSEHENGLKFAWS